MKRFRFLATILACSWIFASVCISTSAVSAIDNNSENTPGKYSIGEYIQDGTKKECLVRTETTDILFNDPSFYEVVYRTTYLVPTTLIEETYTKSMIDNIRMGISVYAYDNDVDKWYQCMYAVEAVERYETRYTETAPGIWENYKWVGLKEVNYGYYTYKDGEGKINLRNPKVRAWQAGFINACFGAQGSYDTEVDNTPIVPPNNNYHAANENSLITWTPPSSWKKVAAIPTKHKMGATFTTTAVDSYGHTSYIELGAVVAS